MKISFDYQSYHQYPDFFDALYNANFDLGLIEGTRKSKFDMSLIKFEPSFVHLWTDDEFIINASSWKCEKLDLEDVYLHFDVDASELKKFTQRRIVKTLNPADWRKF